MNTESPENDFSPGIQMTMNVCDEKLQALKSHLLKLGKVLIAFSGGVDSTFLLKVAVDTLGASNVLACIGVSPSLSSHQHDQAIALARQFAVQLDEIPVGEMEDPAYRSNKADRCFHCKSRLFKSLIETASQRHIPYILCGANFDDKDDYRPGNRAADVFGVLNPLMDAKLTKNEIRELSRKMNLPTADLPSSPCLASRIEYGMQISQEKLAQIEKAEDFLRQIGFMEFRVRHHGNIARIEVNPHDFVKITTEAIRKQIVDYLKSIGFGYIALDLQGFRSGAMNETLSDSEKKKNLH